MFLVIAAYGMVQAVPGLEAHYAPCQCARGR